MTKTPAGERLARRLIAELEARTSTRRPWAVVAELSFDRSTFAKALLAAAERGWVRVDPLAERGEAYPIRVTLTGDGWIEAVRQKASGGRVRPKRRPRR